MADMVHHWVSQNPAISGQIDFALNSGFGRVHRKIRRTQWYANIYFDWAGAHQLRPVSKWSPLPQFPPSEVALPVEGVLAFA